MGKVVTVKINPEFDWAVAMVGGESIPTKQEKFKPLIGYTKVLNAKKEEKIFDELYVRNPDKNVVKRFEDEFRKLIQDSFKDRTQIKLPGLVEVILNISIKKKRFLDVDIDNLSKTVLDCLKGLVIENDSQVTRLLATKVIHPMNISSIFVGLKELKTGGKSLIDSPSLFYYEEDEE